MPTVVVVVAPAHRPDEDERRRGLTALCVERLRNDARALDPAAKTGNYLNNLLALHEARTQGADDALLRNAAGEVTEATTSNVYLVTGGGLVTPSLASGILEGTTRRRILDLCRAAHLPVTERSVGPDDLVRAEEIFLSSSVRGVVSIVRLDGQPVGAGVRGPVTERVHRMFEAAADAEAVAAASGPGGSTDRGFPCGPRPCASREAVKVSPSGTCGLLAEPRAARRLAKVSVRGHDWLAAAGRSLPSAYAVDPCAGLSDRARWVGDASNPHRGCSRAFVDFFTSSEPARGTARATARTPYLGSLFPAATFSAVIRMRLTAPITAFSTVFWGRGFPPAAAAARAW